MAYTFTEFKNLQKNIQFKYFIDTLSITNRTPGYYVNWKKVYDNVSNIELSLNTLNYLLGKPDIYNKTLNLLSKQPELIKVVPILLAIRDTEFPVLNLDDDLNMEFSELNFTNIDTYNIENYVSFMDKTGLLTFLSSKLTNNLVDYVLGVEVGLDSNGRKNRSGDIMEKIIERKIIKICETYDLEYITQATPKNIHSKWNYILPSNEARRRHDFAIYNPSLNKLSVIEVNYYTSGGSKLKSVAGEFISLNSFLDSSDNSIDFIWITDGQGWLTAKNPLQEASLNIEHILNLHMINNNFLETILTDNTRD